MEYHTGKIHSKFQVPSMFAVHMNIPFVKFQYCDLKVLRIVYLQANPDFQNVKTQARNNIFSCGFCSFYISTSSLEITQIVFGPQDLFKLDIELGVIGLKLELVQSSLNVGACWKALTEQTNM